MTIKISILEETKTGEKRVAVVPSVAARLSRLGATLSMQRGAGEDASFADGAYSDVTIVADLVRIVADADIVLAAQLPAASIVGAMRLGAVIVLFVHAASAPELVSALLGASIQTNKAA